jgi:glycosyltransferase involved in cell wall biosynthesis
MGPDPAIGGGMAAALRSLLESPLGERYRLEVVPTYRGPEPLSRLLVFAAALARLALWSLRDRGRVVHVHATVRGSMYRKAVCVLAARALRRRVVLHVHSGAGDIAAFAGSRDPLSRRLFGAAFGAADSVLAVSAASAAAIRDGYGVETPIEVVPNAAPTVPPFVREEGGEEVLVAYLGGFANPVKGGEELLAALPEALAAAPGLRVTLAGPGEPPAQAQALIAAEGERVEWAGYLGPEAKDRLLRSASCLVMPSLSEGLPMALLEAMAYGMAVLATRAGGIPEVVDDGADGLLIDPGDPAAISAGLVRLASDPELRARLGAAARARAEELDAVEVAGRLDRIYSALLARQGNG